MPKQELLEVPELHNHENYQPESRKYDPAQPLPQEILLDNETGVLEGSKAQRLTEQFAMAVAEQMGYGDEFRKVGGGTLPLSQLATDGVIIAADGSNIEMSNAAKEDAVAKTFGEKLLNGEDFYVRRKGEEFPRKISFDRENNCLTIGEQLKEPPEEVPAPGRWQRFANTFRKNKAVTAYNRYQKDKSAYDIVSGQAYQNRVKQTDPIFKARAAEQARKERQLREQKRVQETQKTKEQEAKDYGADFAERVQKRAEDMMADYEYNHPDRPLTETGRNNIIKLCSNYEKAKSDLASGNLKGKNGAVTVRDLLAYELASKGINDPKSNQMMSNVNNRYFSSNMGNLVKETADFRYMIRTGHDADFFRKELDEPQNLEKNMQSVYKKATVMARKADAAYLQEKQNRQTLRMREGITEDMLTAAKNGDVQALKKAAKAEENHVQTHIKPAKELAKNFEARKNQPQQAKPKAPVMN